MKRFWLFPALIALGLVVGCGSSGPQRDINDASNSLVFGHIDMADAPTKISGATILQVAPPTDKPYWGAGVNNGLFYNAYLPPGSYQLASITGSSFLRGDYRYNFPRQGSETAVRITKPGIYYLGSWRYKGVKTGFFEGGKFDVERVNTPTEAQLLQRILDESPNIKGSAWEERIRQRLRQLK